MDLRRSTLENRVVASTQSFKYKYKYQYLSLKYQYQYQYLSLKYQYKYQYLSLKYQYQCQYPCLKYKYKYQYFSSKYQYQYKYLKMVLKYRSSTSTSTEYYNPGLPHAALTTLASPAVMRHSLHDAMSSSTSNIHFFLAPYFLELYK